MNQTTTEHCIDICNKLLRGERSAVETYNQAIERHADSTVRPELERIRMDHQEAVSRLSQSVREMGGVPDEGSGAWGVFARGVQAAANLFGAESAVSNLQNGEQHGRSDYEDALSDEEVMPEHKAMIRDELLPRTQRHIATLERLEDQA
jgi:uncharacterized protein (TIGR02284 family)